MSSNNGLFTDENSEYTSKVNSIPLTDVDTSSKDEASIGTLISNATSQMSTLFRSELELAKAELAGEAKKAALGGGLFSVAGVIALYSSFFFFFFVEKLLAKWLPEWAAFLIIFVVMLIIAAIVAFIGWRKVKKMRAPQNTIDSVSELKNLVPGQATANLEREHPEGFYTNNPVHEPGAVAPSSTR